MSAHGGWAATALGTAAFLGALGAFGAAAALEALEVEVDARAIENVRGIRGGAVRGELETKREWRAPREGRLCPYIRTREKVHVTLQFSLLNQQ